MSEQQAVQDKPREIEDVNFADPAFLADPWTPLIRLQQEAPVYYSKNQGGWIISRYDDVRAVFADRRFSAARVDQLFRGMAPEVRAQLEAVRLYTGLIVNRLDGRDHMRIRALLLKAFDRGVIRKVESFIGDVVDKVLDECERLGEFDFMQVVSAVLPTRVMQRLFGLPDEYQPLLFELASNFTAASAAATVTPELLFQLDRSIRTMNDIFNRFIPERETNPGDDLISMMVHARDGLNKLSNDEMLSNLHGMVVAGAETTAHTLATQLYQIVRQPKLQELLRTAPDRAFDMTTELLRYPGTVKCMTRLAGEEIELHGQTIAKGDLVWIMHAGANIDARHWDAPFETEVDRANLRDSMAFGPGLHFCVGHMLARTELTEFFKARVRPVRYRNSAGPDRHAAQLYFLRLQGTAGTVYSPQSWVNRLSGKTALITGGLRGIGRGITERFLAEGARVMIADLDAASDDLPQAGSDRCIYQRLDVTSDGDWVVALDTLQRRFGVIDILVNNAGTSRAGSIATATEADWRFVFDTNALSVFLGCRNSLRRMGQRSGAIVNIASARGLRPGSGQCAYAASKAAVLSMTQSIALHCGESGLRVRCNAIAPGVIDTPLMRRHAHENGGDAVVASMAAAQITGELGTPDDVAQAAVFLSSDEARFITGTILRVDGGFVIRDK